MDMQKQTYIDGRDPLPTPALDRFAQVAADCKRSDLLECVLHYIDRMPKMGPDEVAEVLRALERNEDGHCSVALQECREDAESQVVALGRVES